jgi:hypothetical protein
MFAAFSRMVGEGARGKYVAIKGLTDDTIHFVLT